MASPQACRKRTAQRLTEYAVVLTSDHVAQQLIFVGLSSSLTSLPTREVKFRDVAIQSGLRAAWVTPIMSHDGKVLGTFGMYLSHQW
jgi:hypothetical protein